jgi:hypothetical protein
MGEVKRVCIICNKSFDFWHSKAKTCGKECSKIYGKQLKRLYKINNPEKSKQSSRNSYYKKNKPQTIKLCKICNKEFICIGNKKTCSNICRYENIRLNGNRNSKIWVKRHPEQRRNITKKYSKENAEILNIKSREWAKKNPEKVIKQVYKWRKNNRYKRNAEANAQRNIPIPFGKICEVCKIELAKHRHHSDYSKPLEVKFVCIKCHKREHQKEVCNETSVQGQ